MFPCVHTSPLLVANAKAERAKRAKEATTEDDYLAAAESHWLDYMPLCNCPECQDY